MSLYESRIRPSQEFRLVCSSLRLQGHNVSNEELSISTEVAGRLAVHVSGVPSSGQGYINYTDFKQNKPLRLN